MDIEIVEFYESRHDDEKSFLEGSLHVYLIDLAMDLRGVYFRKLKNRVHISLPYKVTVDSVTGEKVRYPIIDFTNRKRQKDLLASIKNAAKIFVETKCAVLSNANA